MDGGLVMRVDTVCDINIFIVLIKSKNYEKTNVRDMNKISKNTTSDFKTLSEFESDFVGMLRCGSSN